MVPDADWIQVTHNAEIRDEVETTVPVAEEDSSNSHPIPEKMPPVPYKGLNPYAEADAEIFFGRTRDTQRIINNLLAWPLTVLYGQSGVGKSSVLRAGVIHALREEALQNIEDFGFPKLAIAIFPPLQGERCWQQEPLPILTQQIAVDMSQSGFPMQPPPPELSFVEMLQAWIKQLGEDTLDGQLCIILDQFEEYFQYHLKDEQEGGLIAEISKAIAYPDLHVNFLISLREDSYAKLNRLREYIPGILDICLPLEYLDKPSAQEAIVQPIEQYNQNVVPEQAIEITAELVDALLQGIPRVDQGGDGRAGLDKLEPIRENQILTPYLQLVMIRLWNEMVKANSRCLNLQMLTRLADRNAKDDNEKITSAIQKIVQEHVAETMHDLPAKEQDIATRSFQYLVTPSGTKYAYSADDLANLVGCESTELDNLLQKLAQGQRIIRSVGASPDQPDVPRYEIFHDFLAAAILKWRQQYREEKQRKQRARIAIGLGAVALALVPLAGIVGYRRGVEISTLQAAQSLQQFETGQQINALQQAITSGQSVQKWVKNNPLSLFLGPNQKGRAISQATSSLQQILAGIREQNQFSFPSEQAQFWNLSRDGQTLATVAADGTIQVWNWQTGSLLTSFQAAGQVLGLSFNPDSQSLVAVLADGTVQRWDWQTGQEQARFKTTDSIQFLRFSPTSPVLAIASVNGIVQLWNWQTGNPLPHRFKVSKALLDLCFSPSPSSPILAIASGDGSVQLWNWEADTKQATLKASGAVFNLRFSPDGQTLAAISQEGTVQVWNPQKSAQPINFTPSGSVSSLSFSPDGKLLATGSTEGMVQLWDWQTGKPQASFKAADSLASLRFGSNNQTLITVSSNSRVSVWTLAPKSKQTSFRLSERGEPVLDLSFNPDGQTLTAISSEGTVLLWDWQTGQGSNSPLQPSQPLSAPSVSRDGQTLAGIIGEDYTIIQVWNWKAGGRPVTLKASSPVTYLDFSWDGQMLATFSVDGTVQVWDWKTSRVEDQFHIPGSVAGISFSPDGQTLAAALSNGKLQFWNWRSGQQSKEISISPNAASSPSFSPDDQTLAIAFNNGTIGLWNLQGNSIAQFKSSQPVYSLSFSPDGQTLASGSLGGEVRLWQMESLDTLLTRGCQWLQPYLESHPKENLPCPRRQRLPKLDGVL